MKVLVSDPLAQDGLDILRRSFEVDVKTGLKEDELVNIIGDYDALVVRSGTKVTARIIEAGKKLQVIGRAGVGVDNVDVEAATRCGIVVVNAPDGNTIAAAEHTIALMLALARHIPQAHASLVLQRKWDRKSFMGIEITGKTLGVIGLGRIGREVAQRGRGLGMRVLGYDPYVGGDLAASLGIEICALDDLLAQSDFVTIHVPKTPATVGMIGRRELGLMKPTARLINCARGGIVDEAALQEALTAGKLAGAALDVFANEPPFDSTLLDSPNLIATPHLGASTHEAQVAVAYDVAQQVVDILSGRPATHPVNAPVIPAEVQAQLLPFCELAERLGRAARQLGEKPLNQVRITYAGQLAGMDTDLLRALVIKGLFQDVVESRITPVNAMLVARDHGLRVTEEKTGDAGHFANLITLTFDDAGKERTLSGTIIHGEPFAVRVDEYWLDFTLRGYQLLAFHRDRPGMIGAVGQVTAKHDINIAFMGLGRLQPRGDALMALTFDEYAPAEVLEEIKQIPDIYSVRLLQL